jgi:hypothetical protein
MTDDAVKIRELTRVDGQWFFAWRRCRFVTSAGLADSPEVSPA